MPSIDIVRRLMKIFTVSANQLLNENEKNALIKIINSMLTQKRIKDLLDCKIKLVQYQRSPIVRASLFYVNFKQ
jgi:hypothetical protein